MTGPLTAAQIAEALRAAGRRPVQLTMKWLPPHAADGAYSSLTAPVLAVDVAPDGTVTLVANYEWTGQRRTP